MAYTDEYWEKIVEVALQATIDIETPDGRRRISLSRIAAHGSIPGAQMMARGEAPGIISKEWYLWKLDYDGLFPDAWGTANIKIILPRVVFQNAQGEGNIAGFVFHHQSWNIAQFELKDDFDSADHYFVRAAPVSAGE